MKDEFLINFCAYKRETTPFLVGILNSYTGKFEKSYLLDSPRPLQSLLPCLCQKGKASHPVIFEPVSAEFSHKLVFGGIGIKSLLLTKTHVGSIIRRAVALLLFLLHGS
jgi:hypothetical protein